MQHNQQNTPELKKELSLLDGIMLVAGSMIGSGIFIVSANMLLNIGSVGWLIAAWILSGVMTIIAAVSYGELSSMFPSAGGQYYYLKEAYNQRLAFLYGWSFFSVIQTGTIAAVAVAFAKFLSYMIPWIAEDNVLVEVLSFKFTSAQLIAIGSLMVLTFINSRGIKNGKWIQTILTLIKIVSLLGLIILGFSIGFDQSVWDANWEQAWSFQSYNSGLAVWESISGLAVIAAIAAAMVGSLFSSDAWNGVTFLSAEIKKPERNVGLSLFLGTFVVCLLYVITNLMYIGVMPAHEIALAPQERVAVAASQYIFGPTGTLIIAVMIVISTFGCNNGLIISGARLYYSMAKDKLFFAKAATLNQFNVPNWGLWIQCIWASGLCLTGKYGDLLDYVVIIVLIFYILTIYGIFRLRKIKPNHPRTYKAWGYPVLPILYIVMALAICIILVISKPSTCGMGILIMLVGLPIYYFSKAKSDR